MNGRVRNTEENVVIKFYNHLNMVFKGMLLKFSLHLDLQLALESKIEARVNLR